MKQYFKEFIHNCVVHPLMMVLPIETAGRWHDLNPYVYQAARELIKYVKQ